MCKRTERLSPRSYRCAMKQFLPCQQMRIAPTSIRYRLFQANLCWAADGLHRNLKIETIIGRGAEYSVGHFIDCNPVTRRLLRSHVLLLFCWLVRLLEMLLEWPQIQFVRPGRPVLPVKMPTGRGDRIDVQQSIGATFDPKLGCGRVEFFAIDATVDDDVRDVNSQRPEFARHRLRQRTKAGLGGCECRERRLSAQAGRGARKDDRALTRRRQPSGGLPPDPKSAKRRDTPGLLEELGRHGAEVMANVVARIEHHEVNSVTGSAGEIEQRHHLRLDRGVGDERLGLAAAVDNGANDPRNFCFGAPGNDAPTPFSSEPPRDRGAESLFGADSHNNSRALKRGHCRYLPGPIQYRKSYEARSVSTR